LINRNNLELLILQSWKIRFEYISEGDYTRAILFLEQENGLYVEIYKLATEKASGQNTQMPKNT